MVDGGSNAEEQSAFVCGSLRPLRSPFNCNRRDANSVAQGLNNFINHNL